MKATLEDAIRLAVDAHLESARPAALRLLSTGDRDELRRLGILRPGE